MKPIILSPSELKSAGAVFSIQGFQMPIFATDDEVRQLTGSEIIVPARFFIQLVHFPCGGYHSFEQLADDHPFPIGCRADGIPTWWELGDLRGLLVNGQELPRKTIVAFARKLENETLAGVRLGAVVMGAWLRRTIHRRITILDLCDAGLLGNDR